MKIMKVVYTEECGTDWDGSNGRSYMGENSWSIGEKFNGEFIQGTITEILGERTAGVQINVDGKEALLIPLHAVQRIYYGEE